MKVKVKEIKEKLEYLYYDPLPSTVFGDSWKTETELIQKISHRVGKKLNVKRFNEAKHSKTKAKRISQITDVLLPHLGTCFKFKPASDVFRNGTAKEFIEDYKKQHLCPTFINMMIVLGQSGEDHCQINLRISCSPKDINPDSLDYDEMAIRRGFLQIEFDQEGHAGKDCNEWQGYQTPYIYDDSINAAVSIRGNFIAKGQPYWRLEAQDGYLSRIEDLFFCNGYGLTKGERIIASFSCSLKDIALVKDNTIINDKTELNRQQDAICQALEKMQFGQAHLDGKKTIRRVDEIFGEGV